MRRSRRRRAPHPCVARCRAGGWARAGSSPRRPVPGIARKAWRARRAPARSHPECGRLVLSTTSAGRCWKSIARVHVRERFGVGRHRLVSRVHCIAVRAPRKSRPLRCGYRASSARPCQPDHIVLLSYGPLAAVAQLSDLPKQEHDHDDESVRPGVGGPQGGARRRLCGGRDQECGRFQPAAAGAGDRILLGRDLDARGPAAQDAQPAQPGDARHVEPPARARAAPARRSAQRLQQGGDPRGAAAGRDLRGRARSGGLLPDGPQGVRRGRAQAGCSSTTRSSQRVGDCFSTDSQGSRW